MCRFQAGESDRMKYTRYNIENTLYELDSPKARIWHRVTGFFGSASLVFSVGAVLLVLSFGLGMFRGILDSAPDIDKINVGPTAYATKTYDREGNPVATLVMEGSNRERVSFEEIPTDLVNAVVSVEDERFWKHNGIDLWAILRAVKGVASDDSSRAGGGSTITQQLLKNNVFGGGLHEGTFERYVRKFQEQYLAFELEAQPGMDKRSLKESILTEYLNTINLGSNTLGVKVAARHYFNKEISELTLSECAVIAAITKNPTRLNPITHPENNAKRRAIVLSYMLKQNYITKEQYDQAMADNVYERIQNVNVQMTQDESKPYSYFTDELTEQVMEALQERLGYSREEAARLLYSGGLSIYTTQDPKLQAIVDQEINDPNNYDVQKYSLSWRFSVQHANGTVVNYSEKDLQRWMTEVRKQDFNGLFQSTESAQKNIDLYKKAVLTEGDKILSETADYSLQPQASFILMDPHSGEVLALSGGRGEKKQSLTLNRASNVLRQPGSTFKILSSFAPAIDKYGATLASSYYDSEYSIGTKVFKNWYSGGYLGYQSIRDGIMYSLNIVALRCLMETVQPKNGFEYAQSLGISTLTEEDNAPAIALGGLTRGVSNLELTQAFGAIANGGKLNRAKFFTKIVDQSGKVLIDTTKDEAKQVMKETTAYLLTDAMASSMEFHRAFADTMTINTTSTRAHFDGMSLAGKSGTTTNNRDIWFVGYSPYYIGGIWGGCDENQSLKDTRTGEYNGGTGFHKDIWRNIMQKVHKGLSDPGFVRPAGIVEAKVCRKSGKLPSAGCYEDYRGSAVITELFAEGTVPTEKCSLHTSWGAIRVPENESGHTDDRYFRYVPETTEEEDEEGDGDSDSKKSSDGDSDSKKSSDGDSDSKKKSSDGDSDSKKKSADGDSGSKKKSADGDSDTKKKSSDGDSGSKKKSSDGDSGSKKKSSGGSDTKKKKSSEDAEISDKGPTKKKG